MENRTSDSIGLNELASGQWAVVTDVTLPTDGADGGLVLRLLELGFVPGERVRVLHGAWPGNDPLAVRVGRTTFALRRREACFIRVAPVA